MNTSVSTRINLPEGPVKGLRVTGYPVRVASFDTHMEAIGLFVESLQVPGLSISNFRSVHHFVQALAQYEKLQRTIVLSCVISESDSTLYGVNLPAAQNLGIILKGFPPVVVDIQHNSIVRGRFQLGQVVERVIIPSRNVDISLATGGFTDQNVITKLNEHCQAPDRQLVVKNEKPPPAQKGSNAPIDWGSFQNRSLNNLFKRQLVARGKPAQEFAVAERIEVVDNSRGQEFIPLVKAELI